MAKRRQGFAVLDPARQWEIASQGGKAAHAQKVAHRWTSAEAAAAGRKGGQAAQRRRLERERTARTKGA
jgi:general stress protein YciG